MFQLSCCKPVFFSSLRQYEKDLPFDIIKGFAAIKWLHEESIDPMCSTCIRQELGITVRHDRVALVYWLIYSTVGFDEVDVLAWG